MILLWIWHSRLIPKRIILILAHFHMIEPKTESTMVIPAVGRES